jgi:hypothetical protein
LRKAYAFFLIALHFGCAWMQDRVTMKFYRDFIFYKNMACVSQTGMAHLSIAAEFIDSFLKTA